MRFKLVLLWCLTLGVVWSSCQPTLAQVKGLRRNILPAGGLINLVMRSKGIQKDVGLHEDYATLAELAKLQEAMIKAYNEESKAASKADREDPDLITVRVHAKFNPELQKLIKPEHYARLKQIQWQEMGNEALLEAEMMQILEISDEQRTKIVAALNLFYDKMSPKDGKHPDQEATTAGFESLHQELRRILTPEQEAKFTKTLGSSFRSVPRFTDPPQRPQRKQRLSRGSRPRHQSLVDLALDDHVLKDVGIAKDQQMRIRKLLQPMSDEWNLLTVQQRIDEAYMAKFNAGYDAELQGILQPDQFTRLKQIRWQGQGSRAFEDPELIKTLDLDDGQQRQTARLMLEVGRKLSQALNPKDEQEFVKEEAVRKRYHEELAEELREIKSILSTAQYEKFTALQGKPFDTDLFIRWTVPAAKK